MDDLRRLLALQQRELESLQRQSDARAASARKAPSSPHLVQLRKLYNTLAKQRRHVEALEVLRTLESLEWREAESQREEAEQRNEAELEAMLQRHGGERQLLEQHLLRTQHTTGATDLASSWGPEPPAAPLEPQHDLQQRHRRLRSVPPSLPCEPPHMLRRGASYEPEHNQQGTEDCGACSWQVAGEVPMQRCLRVECRVSSPCSPYSMGGNSGADAQAWPHDLQHPHSGSQCCWQQCGGDIGPIGKLGPPPQCSPGCRAAGQPAAGEHVFYTEPPMGGGWSYAAAGTANPDADCLQLNVELQDTLPPVRQSYFSLTGEVEDSSAVQQQQQPAEGDSATSSGSATVAASTASTGRASQVPIAVFDSADWDVFSTLQQAAEQWYCQQAPRWAQPPACPGQRGCTAPVQTRGAPPRQPQSPLAQRLSQLRYSPAAGQTRPGTPGATAQLLQPPGWIRAVPGRRAGSAPAARGGDYGSSGDDRGRSTQALERTALPSITGQAQRPWSIHAPSVVKQEASGPSSGSLTGRLAVLKRQTSLPVWAAGMPRTTAGPLRPSPLQCGATSGMSGTFVAKQVRLAEEHAVLTSCSPGQPILQPQQPKQVPNQLMEQATQQGPHWSCTQPRFQLQECGSGEVAQGAGEAPEHMQCAREASPPVVCEQAAAGGSGTKGSRLLPESLHLEHGAASAAVDHGFEPHATQLAGISSGAQPPPAQADANQQPGGPVAAPAAPLAGPKPNSGVFTPRPEAFMACVPDHSVPASQHSTVPHCHGEVAVDASHVSKAGGQLPSSTYSAGGTALSGGVAGQQGRAATETPRSPSTDGHSEDAEAAADLLNYCRYGRYEDARQLMREAKIPIDVRDMSGNTPLMLACQGSYGRLVKLCLRKGAEINAQNAAGETALLLAAAAEHRGCAKYLLKNGADPTLKTKDGHTAEELILKWAAGWAADWHLREPDLHT